MCDAILKFSNMDDSEVDIEATLIPSKLCDLQTDMPAKVKIKNNTFYMVEVLSKAFKSSQKKENKAITGYVKKLELYDIQKDKSESLNGYVTINFFEEGKNYNIKVYLEDKDYKLACDAHKAVKKVSIRGELDRSGKYWTLDSAHDFRLVEE